MRPGGISTGRLSGIRFRKIMPESVRERPSENQRLLSDQPRRPSMIDDALLLSIPDLPGFKAHIPASSQFWAGQAPLGG
jgi:hypothetical protein